MLQGKAVRRGAQHEAKKFCLLENQAVTQGKAPVSSPLGWQHPGPTLPCLPKQGQGLGLGRSLGEKDFDPEKSGLRLSN